jgi:putative SOS response-associated peptidase YedK
MCFTISIPLAREEIEKRFGAKFLAGTEYKPAWYLSAFSLPYVPVVPAKSPGEVQMLRWGLIPYWVKDRASAESIQVKTFNARAESITEKPSFRNPIRNKRCLVISCGFFEWQQRGTLKIPHYIYLKDGQPFAFAGIYDDWTDPETGEMTSTFSIITTKANPMMEKIHNTRQRMPVILPADVEKDWLNTNTDQQQILSFLNPLDDSLMQAYTISRLISMPGAEKNIPEIIRPFSYDETALS